MIGAQYWYSATWSLASVPQNPTPVYNAESAPTHAEWARLFGNQSAQDQTPTQRAWQQYMANNMYADNSDLGNYLGISRKPLIDPDLTVDIGL